MTSHNTLARRGPRMAAAVVAALLAVAAGGFSEVRAADAPAPAINANSDPAQLVQSVAGAIFKELSEHRAEYKGDPAKVKDLANRYLLPYFDTQYAAQLVLGRNWRTATPEQRTRFINAFQNSLLQNYGNAIVEFRADRLKVLPSRTDPGSTSASVSTTITRDNGSVTSVVYVLHKTPTGWKDWDVVVEGISYVKSFRDDFATQIDQSGLDAVIKRLEAGSVPVPGGK